MKSVRPILIALAAALAVAVGCERRARVIPADTFSEIYADMFLADQWIASNSRYRRKADTSLFYVPIFGKYGYSLKDYDLSVRYYLESPDKYAKILKQSAALLEKDFKRLKKIEDAINKRPVFEPYKPEYFDKDSLMLKDTLKMWPNDSTILFSITDGQDTTSQEMLLVDGLDDIASSGHPDECEGTCGQSDTLAAGVPLVPSSGLDLRVPELCVDSTR